MEIPSPSARRPSAGARPGPVRDLLGGETSPATFHFRDSGFNSIRARYYLSDCLAGVGGRPTGSWAAWEDGHGCCRPPPLPMRCGVLPLLVVEKHFGTDGQVGI